MKKALRLLMLYATVLITSANVFAQCGNLSFNDNQADCRVSLGKLNAIASGIPGEYSFEAWIKTRQQPTPGSFQWIFGDEQNLNGGIHIGLYENFISTFSPGTWYVNSAYRVAVNTWTHIAFVQNSNALKLYVNGKFIQTLLTYPNLHRQTNDESFLGQFTDHLHGFWRNFEGNMDEVRIWNYARSAADIKKYTDQKISENAKGLVALYTMDDNDGFEIADQSGHGNKGKITGIIAKENGNAVNYLPVDLKAENITATTVLLHWKQQSCGEGFTVKYKNAKEDHWTEQYVGAGKDSVSIYHLKPSTVYAWQIGLLNALLENKEAPATQPLKFTTAGDFNASESSNKTNQSVVVPNLIARSQVWKILSPVPIHSITLINANGQVVFNAADNKNNVVLNNLNKGIYFYMLTTLDADGTKQIYKGKLMITD